VDWQAAFIARAVAAYTKTYWVNAPQNTGFPYATLLDVTELRPQILGGFDLEFARVQIDVWALKYADVQTGMAALIGTAAAPGPLILGGTFNGHTFQRGDIALGPRDIGGEREGDTIIYRKSADLIVPHS
jgi:hypothetical protein